MTQGEALKVARKRWGGSARVIGEDDGYQGCRVGLSVPPNDIWAEWGFVEYGKGDTWEEAFEDATEKGFR